MSTPSASLHARRRSPWQIQKAVLFALLQRELKGRFGGRWLGAFWILFEPIAHLSYLMVLFGLLRGLVVPGVPVPLFLITGLIPFFIFRSLSLNSRGSIDSNRGLFGYRQVKPLDTILARAGAELLLHSGVYVIFLAVFGWADLQWFPDEPLQLMMVSAVLIAMAVGLGLIFLVTTDNLPQLRVFVRLLYLPLYLMSGVIFPPRALGPQALDWLMWNPLLHLLELGRAAFFKDYHALPDVSLAYPAAVALGALALGTGLYRVRRHHLLAS